MIVADRQVRTVGVMLGASTVLLATQQISQITHEARIANLSDLPDAAISGRKWKRKRNSLLQDQSMKRLNKRVQML